VLILKCSGCGRRLTGNVFRIDKGSFGNRPIDHFLEEFKFKERIGYFCERCFKLPEALKKD